MCCYCSLRGAVYFGTSVHIFVGLVLLVRWIVLTYLGIFVTQKLVDDTSSLIWAILFGVYVLFFIILGCLIFSGVEKNSVTLLKWSASGFTMLQVLAFTVILVLYLFAPASWSFAEQEYASNEMLIILMAVYFCCLIATINYILVLFLYIRKLWRSKREHNNGSSGTGRSNSLTNIQISHPIPHHSLRSNNHNPNNSTMTTNSSAPYGRVRVGTRGGGGGIIGPESPGIYESLDAGSVAGYHHFYPANFYTGYNPSRPQQHQHQQQPQQLYHSHSHPHQHNLNPNPHHHPHNNPPPHESIYNSSIRGGPGSGNSNSNPNGIYYYSPTGRPQLYSYPTQRYRDPVIPSTSGTASSMASVRRGEDNTSTGDDLDRETPTPGQEWTQAYGHRLHVFQKGNEDGDMAVSEPLLQQSHNNAAAIKASNNY